MSTITAILDADPDGSLHLPLPLELRGARVKVSATLEQAKGANPRAIPGLWKNLPNRFWMSSGFDEPLADFKDYME